MTFIQQKNEQKKPQNIKNKKKNLYCLNVLRRYVAAIEESIFAICADLCKSRHLLDRSTEVWFNTMPAGKDTINGLRETAAGVHSFEVLYS